MIQRIVKSVAVLVVSVLGMSNAFAQITEPSKPPALSDIPMFLTEPVDFCQMLPGAGDPALSDCASITEALSNSCGVDLGQGGDFASTDFLQCDSGDPYCEGLVGAFYSQGC